MIAIILVPLVLINAVSAAFSVPLVSTIAVGSEPLGTCLNPNTNRLYVANYGSNSVSIVDCATNAVLKTLGNVGNKYKFSNPCAVAVNPTTGLIFVVNNTSYSVTVVNGATDTTIKKIPLYKDFPCPWAICVNPVTNRIYVANSGTFSSPGDKISIIDGNSLKVVRTRTVGLWPTSIGVDTETNRVFVANTASNTVSVLDDTHPDNPVMTHELDGFIAPNGIAVSPSRNMVYVANQAQNEGGLRRGVVSVICEEYHEDTHTWTFATVKTFGVGRGYRAAYPDDIPDAIALKNVNQGLDRVYVSNSGSNTVSIAEVSGIVGTVKYRVYGTSGSVCLSGATNRGYVADSNTNAVSVFFDGPSNTAKFYFAEGTCRPGFDPYISIQNLGTGTAIVTLSYIKGDGSHTGHTIQVSPSSRATVVVKDILGEGDDPAHDFATRVECSNGQKIIAERPMYFNYKGQWTGGTDVVGTTCPTTRCYFAEGTTRPGFETYLCILNMNSSTATMLITFMKGDSAIKQHTVDVGACSRATVTCSDILGIGDDESHDFSVKVESTNGLATVVERPMYFDYRGLKGGTNVIGSPILSTSFYFAEGTCRPGFDTYFCIQNPGDTSAQVALTFTRGRGDSVTLSGESKTLCIDVGAGSRATVFPEHVLGSADSNEYDFFTQVKSANGALILAERPMYFNYKGWTGGTDVVGSPHASAWEYCFAEGTCRPYFDSYLCIMNPEGPAVNAASSVAHLKITLQQGDGKSKEYKCDINANTRFTVNCRDILELPEGDDNSHDFSIRVSIVKNKVQQAYVVERPMYFNYGGKWTGGTDVIGYPKD
ncbi:MAG: YncE family protein [Actinobacteria bacterium]|nr:YncE family protein [Actinomycetota bacterium]MBU1942277.1 YncE family protein [Actinomycetota bacterium]MBU2687374.1 YncE family protein [Actinomycetota bacterium]